MVCVIGDKFVLRNHANLMDEVLRIVLFDLHQLMWWAQVEEIWYSAWLSLPSFVNIFWQWKGLEGLSYAAVFVIL